MGPNELLTHRWKKAAFLLLLPLVVLAAWLTYRALMSEPTELSEEDLIQALLERARQSEAGQISAETPAMWVQVENLEPISNVNNRFLPKATCITKEGDQAILVKREEQRLFLRYSTLNDPGGTACPNGTLFSVSTAKAANHHNY